MGEPARGPVLPAAEVSSQLAALALRQSADGLAGSNAALGQYLVDLDPSVLRHRQEQIEDLHGCGPLRGFSQDRMDRGPAALQVTLELGSTGADVVGLTQRTHTLSE